MPLSNLDAFQNPPGEPWSPFGQGLSKTCGPDFSGGAGRNPPPLPCGFEKPGRGRVFFTVPPGGCWGGGGGLTKIWFFPPTIGLTNHVLFPPSSQVPPLCPGTKKNPKGASPRLFVRFSGGGKQKLSRVFLFLGVHFEKPKPPHLSSFFLSTPHVNPKGFAELAFGLCMIFWGGAPFQQGRVFLGLGLGCSTQFQIFWLSGFSKKNLFFGSHPTTFEDNLPHQFQNTVTFWGLFLG